MDNLVERVGEAIWNREFLLDANECVEIARLAIPIVMEEAAKLTEEHFAVPGMSTYEAAGMAIARAIRTRSSEIAGLSKESE